VKQLDKEQAHAAARKDRGEKKGRRASGGLYG
jgi:hypothetical protein